MAFYESVLIARQDISAAQVDTLVEEFKNLLQGNGGQVTKTEYWGLRNLSYRIKKNRKGHYVLLNLEAPSAAVQEFERNMRLHEDVLRYLTVRVDALEEGPSIVMQSRSRDRDGRFRDRDRGHRGDRDRGDRDRGDRDRDRGPRGGRDDDRPRAAASAAAKPEGEGKGSDAKPDDKPAESGDKS
jgi:small subunit ribosomal protein S6